MLLLNRIRIPFGALAFFLGMQTPLICYSLPSAVKKTTISAPETNTNGPFQTATAEYRLPATVDRDVLENFSTEIWGRVYWPTPLLDTSPTSIGTKKRPLLIFLHGNHGTCGSGKSPRLDDSCEYTNSGKCPSGSVVTPNHEGYNYVADALASWGYIVVSINANRGITCGGGNSDDSGLILARGRLVLKHLQLWNEWTTKGGSPRSLGATDMFKNLVDLTNVGLMGHSRGGEGVRAALNIYRDASNPWVAKIPGLDIRAVYEVGAVDGQSNRVLDAPSVAWNQTLPLCDGDVSNLEGRLPFERMLSRFSTKNETESRPSPKSLTMVWGANHNYFNTEWQTSDSSGCEGSPSHKEIFDSNKSVSPQQQTILRQSMTAFFRAHVGANKDSALAATFDPAFALPGPLSAAGVIDRDFIAGYEIGTSFSVDDFTARTGTNPAGPKNTLSAVTVDHDNNSTPSVANVSWTKAGEDRFFQSNFKELGQSANISSFDYLDLRVGRVTTNFVKNLKTEVEFSIQLVAANDALSNPVLVSDFSKVRGPPNEQTDLTQTVRIPLESFGNFDLKNVRGVRFVFNRTEKGKVRFAHVRFSVKPEKMTPFTEESVARVLSIKTNSSFLIGLRPPSFMETSGEIFSSNDIILADQSSKPAVSIQRGTWLKPQKVAQSIQLKGASGIELGVATLNGEAKFPVLNSLPVLKVGDLIFPISRFDENGDTGKLVFTLSRESFSMLPDSGRAQVQYGLKNPTRIWELPQFSKAAVDRDLGE